MSSHGFRLPQLFSHTVGGGGGRGGVAGVGGGVGGGGVGRGGGGSGKDDSNQKLKKLNSESMDILNNTTDREAGQRDKQIRNTLRLNYNLDDGVPRTMNAERKEQSKDNKAIEETSKNSPMSRLLTVRLVPSKETTLFKSLDPYPPPPSDRSMDPTTAMRYYMKFLSSFEHQEIFLYPEIYFVGTEAQKRQAIPWSENQNSGFDDTESNYVLIYHDHVAYRYEVLKILGKGSFGQVVKAYDHREKKYVALKVVRNEKRFHRQAQVEIRILDHLRKQDARNRANVVHMMENFVFRNHVCITFELLSINLYEVLKRTRFHGFRIPLVRKFSFSILHCLDFLYQNRLIHCDLKPENILLKQPGRSGIKVIDFGSSCYEHQQVYTYIQSRYYRSPEVILGARYSMAIDMWSLGCIVAELYTGYPLFTGEDEGDQLACIIETCGIPKKRFLKNCKREKHFFDSRGLPRYCMEKRTHDGKGTILAGGLSAKGKYRGTPGSRQLDDAFFKKGNDELMTEFVRRCLEVVPDERWTPEEALRHTWLRSRPVPAPVPEKTSTTAARGSFAGEKRSSQKLIEKGRTLTNKVSSHKTEPPN